VDGERHGETRGRLPLRALHVDAAALEQSRDPADELPADGVEAPCATYFTWTENGFCGSRKSRTSSESTSTAWPLTDRRRCSAATRAFGSMSLK